MATQQEILAWLASNPQATDRDIAAAMNQYGVSAQDLSGATGWDQNAVNDRYSVANAQNYIDTQWSDPLMQLPGNQDQRNWGILGATQGMGLTDDQQARAMGWTPDAVQSYEQQYAPHIDTYKSIYQKDLTNPAPYMQPVQPTSTGLPQLPAPQAAPQLPGPIRSPITQAQPGANVGGVPAGMGQGGWQPGQLPPGLNGVPFSPTGGYQTGPNTGGAGDQGMFGQQYGGYQASPWLSATADEIGRRTQQGLQQAFNGIRSNAVGVGGLGGSRQGVAEGIATRGAMDSLQGNLAGLFGSDWTNAQNRGLTARGQDQGFYTAQRGQDLAQIGLGADIYDRGVRGGWAPIQNANSVFGNYTGFGNTTSSSNQGGGWQGALGGALAGATTGRQMGWW